jgi:mRNA-degrading endonuclease RelE of RelBE toxin-antitoxin system
VKAKRKLSGAAQRETDEQVGEISENPFLGEKKSGVLKDVRVVKFKAKGQQYLLGYLFNEKTNVVEFLDIGVHENYYKGLADYVKARPKHKK